MSGVFILEDPSIFFDPIEYLRFSGNLMKYFINVKGNQLVQQIPTTPW